MCCESPKTSSDVKYIRWTKYGHPMANKFYKIENLAEFKQKTKIRINKVRAGISSLDLTFAVIKLSAFSRFCAVECGVDCIEILRIHLVSGKS